MKLREFGSLRPETKSILEEINEFAHSRNKEDLIESRANHIIESAINLIEQINEHYDEETANLLQRRLLNSIKGRDSKKFSRLISKIKENKNGL